MKGMRKGLSAYASYMVYFLPTICMADRVEHVHTTNDTGSDTSALFAVVLIVVLLAIIGFALYAYNANVRSAGSSGTNVNIEGQIDVPEVNAPVTPTPAP
jgi:hypothetical protein